MKKRILSFVLCVIMLFSMNATVFAAEDAEVEVTAEEGMVTIEVMPTSLYATSPDKHSIGSLNAFFGEYDSVAESTIGSFTIRSTSVPAGATITKIVVTSSKSSGSTGNIVLYVAKDEDNGDGTFDRYIDNKTWASSLTFSDFGNYDLSAAGTYYVQFASTRYSTGTIAAATLKNVYVSVYYK
ncbi:MAG: hypothetical protein K2N73_15385 [Lachnospiraceae bacterium]|nr:hypothetical protein [Lachnospiraceae bacterium]